MSEGLDHKAGKVDRIDRERERNEILGFQTDDTQPVGFSRRTEIVLKAIMILSALATGALMIWLIA